MLSLDGEGPLHRQVYRSVRDAIVRRALPPGGRAPASRALAAELGISRATVVLAYEQLAAEGFLVPRRGSGSWVREIAPPPAAARAAPAIPAASPARAPRLSTIGARLATATRHPLESGYASDRPRLRWDFRHGLPAIADFPLQTWHRTLARVARRAPARSYDYGPPNGSGALRRALAAYLGRSRGVSCDPAQLLIVTGSQQGLDLTRRVLVDPGDAVVVEDPGYEGARAVVALSGARVVPVPVDDEGLDTARLEPARLAVVTPSHQYPLGGVMSYARRAALLEWASRGDAWIVEDDYDGEFRYEGLPFPALKAIDAGDRVIYLGTLSKVMFPSLRLGYLVMPEALVAPLTRAKMLADGGSARLEQEALAELIESGAFERHLRRARGRYAERRHALLDALAADLPDRVEVVGANAGLHLVAWIRDLPARATGALVRRAAAHGIGLYPITPYCVAPPTRAGLILGYAGLSPREIRAGVAALADLLG